MSGLFGRLQGRLMSHLPIVLLAIDSTAVAVLLMAQVAALAAGHNPVCFCHALIMLEPLLAMLEVACLAGRQLAVAHAITDTALLIGLALMYNRCSGLGKRVVAAKQGCCHREGKKKAFHVTVFLF